MLPFRDQGCSSGCGPFIGRRPCASHTRPGYFFWVKLRGVPLCGLVAVRGTPTVRYSSKSTGETLEAVLDLQQSGNLSGDNSHSEVHLNQGVFALADWEPIVRSWPNRKTSRNNNESSNNGGEMFARWLDFLHCFHGMVSAKFCTLVEASSWQPFEVLIGG